MKFQVLFEFRNFDSSGFQVRFPIPEAWFFSYLPACQISDDYFWQRKVARGPKERDDRSL